MDRKTIQLIFRILFCIYICAVGFLCFMKPSDMPEFEMSWFGLPSDKVAHFMMFLPFPILSFLAVRKADGSTGSRFLLLAVLFAAGALIAAGTEILQSLTKYRSYEVKDMLTDFAGLAAGSLITALSILISGKAATKGKR